MSVGADPSSPQTEPPASPDALKPFLGFIAASVMFGLISMAPLALICRPVGVLVGFVYPAYASYKALESKTPESAAQWLTYWVVFSLFSVLEFFTDRFISWVPLYYIGKLGFVLWLQLPQFKGAQVIFVQVIQPNLKKHEEQIDKALEEGRNKATSNFNDLKQRGMTWLQGSQLMHNRGAAARAQAAAPAEAAT